MHGSIIIRRQTITQQPGNRFLLITQETKGKMSFLHCVDYRLHKICNLYFVALITFHFREFAGCGIYHNNLVYGGGLGTLQSKQKFTMPKTKKIKVKHMTNTTLVNGKMVNESLDDGEVHFLKN